MAAARLSLDCVAAFADSCELGTFVSPEALSLLTEDTNYRLRYLLNLAKRFARHSKRDRLKVVDIEHACKECRALPQTVTGQRFFQEVSAKYVDLDGQVFTCDEGYIDLAAMVGQRSLNVAPLTSLLKTTWSVDDDSTFEAPQENGTRGDNQVGTESSTAEENSKGFAAFSEEEKKLLSDCSDHNRLATLSEESICEIIRNFNKLPDGTGFNLAKLVLTKLRPLFLQPEADETFCEALRNALIILDGICGKIREVTLVHAAHVIEAFMADVRQVLVSFLLTEVLGGSVSRLSVLREAAYLLLCSDRSGKTVGNVLPVFQERLLAAVQRRASMHTGSVVAFEACMRFLMIDEQALKIGSDVHIIFREHLARFSFIFERISEEKGNNNNQGQLMYWIAWNDLLKRCLRRLLEEDYVMLCAPVVVKLLPLAIDVFGDGFLHYLPRLDYNPATLYTPPLLNTGQPTGHELLERLYDELSNNSAQNSTKEQFKSVKKDSSGGSPRKRRKHRKMDPNSVFDVPRKFRLRHQRDIVMVFHQTDAKVRVIEQLRRQVDILDESVPRARSGSKGLSAEKSKIVGKVRATAKTRLLVTNITHLVL